MMTLPSKEDVKWTLKLLILSAVIAAAYPLIAGKALNGRNLCDGLSIAGLGLLVVGLFRLVNRIGLFDSAKFGFGKFWEVIRTKDYVPSRSKTPTFADYKEQHPYRKSYLPILVAAALDIALALLAAA